MSITEDNSRSSTCGLSDAGSDSNSRCKTPTKCLFRPSKLSAVTDQMWKKDLTETKKSEIPINLFDKTSPNSNSSNPSASVGNSNRSNFVFGQNIKDRVLTVEKDEHDENLVSSSSSFNGKIEFKDVVKESDEGDETKHCHQSTSLEESAKAYEAKNQSKVQLLDQIEVKTGEEGETNIVQVFCKLHVFDSSNQTWNERGAAILRINDKNLNEVDGNDKLSTRIVVRLQGCLRVMINSTVYPDMLIERPSTKRLKMSAIDADSKALVFYLITLQAPQSEIDKIEEIINDRLKTLDRSFEEKRKSDDARGSASVGKKQKIA